MPSWAISAALHTVILLILGIWTIANIENPQLELECGFAELDSSEDFDHSPLTEFESPQSPPVEELESAAMLPVDFGSLPAPDTLALSGTTSVFGVKGEGRSFVYVFDRSGSMRGPPLTAAKAELLESVDSLQPHHEFQVIFYSGAPQLFNPTQRAGLNPADDAMKQQVRHFVNSIAASGGTNHVSALTTALRMSPDNIFFLTDAGAPQLTEAELRAIRSANRRTLVHAIQFGFGPEPDYSVLRKLAKENGGQYVYIDASTFTSPITHANTAHTFQTVRSPERTQKIAASKLALAKKFLATGKPKIAQLLLKDIIDQFPATDAKTEAAQLLKSL